tara:strand:+ start:2799 stop:2969 length:171 start_codon:yes stop_codon:yes gene_type:complete
MSQKVSHNIDGEATLEISFKCLANNHEIAIREVTTQELKATINMIMDELHHRILEE